MGFHVCHLCNNDASSGDITLRFSSGRAWVMPDMILHYIAEHGYMPPKEFQEDIWTSTMVESERIQTKGLQNEPAKVGYLDSEQFNRWGSANQAQALLFMKLWQLIQIASQSGGRRQTRSAS